MSLEDGLDDYKESVNPITRATLKWKEDLVFEGLTQRGYDLDFDANMEWGCMPVEGVLLSLGGCLAIDVVSILGKMRCPPTAFRMDLEGERNVTPPQRFLRMKLVLHLTGEDLAEEKVNRAVELSRDKYCSVANTLRDDLDIEVEVRLNEE